MRLFGSFKVTDRIRIGGSTGGGRKRKSSKGGSGCGLIIVVLMIICVPIALIKSCVGGDEPKTVETTSPVSSIGVEELYIVNDEYELDVGDDRTGWVRVKGTENFTVDDFVFVSADESIATIEYDSTSLDTYLYFVIKGISPGTTTVYVKTADDAVISEEITVTVLEAETTTEAETTVKTNDAPAAEQDTPEENEVKKQNVEYILNTNTKKIHYSSCSSVEDIKPENRATTNDFNGALDQGYEPCKRCNPSDN